MTDTNLPTVVQDAKKDLIFTPEQIELVSSQLCPGANADEIKVFLWKAQRAGLDPFTRQIYLIARNMKLPDGSYGKKYEAQTSVDGFRVVAERSKQYQGQLGPFWCGLDGVWKDIWLDGTRLPSAAKVGVIKAGFKEPLWAVALTREYIQTDKQGNPQAMWAKMPALMIAKVAECLALRKAFPQDLSGLYAQEEMPDEDAIDVTPKHAPQPQLPDLGKQDPLPPQQPSSSQGFPEYTHPQGDMGNQSKPNYSPPQNQMDSSASPAEKAKDVSPPISNDMGDFRDGPSGTQAPLIPPNEPKVDVLYCQKIMALCKEKNIPSVKVSEFLELNWGPGKTIWVLTQKQAERLMEHLQNLRPINKYLGNKK
jgi:phage recombination protein Bet